MYAYVPTDSASGRSILYIRMHALQAAECCVTRSQTYMIHFDIDKEHSRCHQAAGMYVVPENVHTLLVPYTHTAHAAARQLACAIGLLVGGESSR